MAKYFVLPQIYDATTVWIMNLDTWNSLTKEQQDIIMNVFIDGEPTTFMQAETTTRDENMQIMKEAGVEFYSLEPDVAEWFVDTAYNAAWDYQMERFPEVTTALKALLSP